MDREIAVMHLVKHYVVYRLYLGSLVLSPSFGIGGSEIYDGGAVTVHADGFGPYTGSLVKPFAVHIHLESIEFTVWYGSERSSPGAVFGFLHINGLQGLAVTSLTVNPELDGSGLGRPQTETGIIADNGEFQVLPLINRVGKIFGICISG